MLFVWVGNTFRVTRFLVRQEKTNAPLLIKMHPELIMGSRDGAKGQPDVFADAVVASRSLRLVFQTGSASGVARQGYNIVPRMDFVSWLQPGWRMQEQAPST